MPDSAFWNFSLQFYARDGVGASCIELQDQYGVDVNVLLYLFFLATQGRAVARDDVTRIDAEVRAWRDEVVKPLRSVRRALRSTIGASDSSLAQSLRTEVKRIELEAERIQQETLERIFPPSGIGVTAPSRGKAGRTNVAAYQAYLGRLPDAPVASLLQAFDAAVQEPP